LVAATVGINHLKELHAWMKRLDPGTEMAVFRDTFTLENGLEQLQPFFSGIQTLRYEDSLRITELPPLMAYLKSTTSYGDNPESAFANWNRNWQPNCKQTAQLKSPKTPGCFWRESNEANRQDR
jgi:hypothetical protein